METGSRPVGAEQRGGGEPPAGQLLAWLGAAGGGGGALALFGAYVSRSVGVGGIGSLLCWVGWAGLCSGACWFGWGWWLRFWCERPGGGYVPPWWCERGAGVGSLSCVVWVGSGLCVSFF